MTTAELLSDLISRGVEFQTRGDKLRFRPTDRLTPADVESIRQHKVAMLGLLRAEGPIDRLSTADHTPRETCDRCGTHEYTETPIHDGQSLRRDCSSCHRFLGWPRWYGRQIDSPAPKHPEEP